MSTKHKTTEVLEYFETPECLAITFDIPSTHTTWASHSNDFFGVVGQLTLWRVAEWSHFR